MRRKIAAGNWKMNGTLDSVDALLDGLLPAIADNQDADILLFPAFVHLAATKARLSGSPARLGGQNVSVHAKGAHTGEVSGPMLKDLGCEFVLVGHSERRALYGETDGVVAAKFEAAQQCGLVP
ncbi:MAG: triose-phosphate isomerase, partial [Pseudomonadota bacterium]